MKQHGITNPIILSLCLVLDFIFNNLGIPPSVLSVHLLPQPQWWQPVWHGDKCSVSQPYGICTGGPLTLWHWVDTHVNIFYAPWKCQRLKGFAFSFFGTILEHVCTAPKNVPTESNLLTTLMACSIRHTWIILHSQSHCLFPWNHFQKKRSVSGSIPQRKPRVRQVHYGIL